MNNIIKWEKWINPIGVNTNRDETFTLEEYMKDGNDSAISVEEVGYPRLSTTMPYALTQYGILPINFYKHADQQLNYWIGNTNFDITEDVKHKIVQFPGVEIWDVFSRYRFRICVGATFNAKKVIGGINEMFDVPAVITRNLNLGPIDEITEKSGKQFHSN